MLKYRNAVLIVLLWVLIGSLQPAHVMADGFGVEINSIKPSYLVAEPVFIDIIVKNTDDKSAMISPELAVETENLSMFVARGEADPQQYHPGFVVEPSRMPIELDPGQTVVHRQLILFNSLIKDYAFPAPGTYRVHVLLHGFGLRPDVRSNIIEIQINKPAGAEAEVLQLFKNKDVADLIMNLNEATGAVTNLELLMTQHPETIYGKYAQFYLARRQTQEFFERKPNYPRAIELYKDLVKRDPNFPLVIEVNKELGVALVNVGQYDEARERFQFVLKNTRITQIRETVDRYLLKIQTHEPAPPVEKPR